MRNFLRVIEIDKTRNDVVAAELEMAPISKVSNDNYEIGLSRAEKDNKKLTKKVMEQCGDAQLKEQDLTWIQENDLGNNKEKWTKTMYENYVNMGYHVNYYVN